MEFRTLMTAALLAAASTAFAAAGDGSAPSRGNRALDQNGDGMISREEAAVRPRLAQSFDRLDSNRDGALSREELREGHRSGHHGRRASLDTNGDGSIAREEARTAPRLAEKFDAIDADKDGALTRDELAAWRRSHSRPSSGAPAEPVKPKFAVDGRRRNTEVHAVPAHDAKAGQWVTAGVIRQVLGSEGCPRSVGCEESTPTSRKPGSRRGFPARGSSNVRHRLNLCSPSPSNKA